MTNPPEQAAPANYEERYCAFVDILGFRQLIERLENGKTSVETMRAVLATVHSPWLTLDSLGADVRSQSISDAVALSAPVTGKDLTALCWAIRALALDLLCEGFLIRGALVRGPLFHDQHMVFGRALVRAYEFESEVARYPRIVVSREVREDIIRFRAQAKRPQDIISIEDLRQSEDGPMYLHVLAPVAALARKHGRMRDMTTTEATFYRRFSAVALRLQERYEEAMDTPSHFEKVRWFCDYWNDVIPANTLGNVRGAGMSASTF